MTSITGQRSHVLPIFLCTIVYLVVELAFNATLLDVVGTTADRGRIDSVENWGRTISGVAVALFAWGTVIMPLSWRNNWPRPKLAAALAGSAVILISVTYMAEKWLIDHLAASADGKQRRAAVELRVVDRALMEGSLRLANFSLDKTELTRPEGKTFLALFSFVANTSISEQQDIHRGLREVFRQRSEKQLGGPEHLFNTRYLESLKRLRAAYDSYQKAAAGAPSSDPDILWQQYRDQIQQEFRLPPEELPGRYWRTVAQQVRQSGVPVPLDWNPMDHQAFVAAARGKILEVQSRQLPPGLSWPSFLRQPSVLSQWQAEIATQMPSLDVTSLVPALDFDTFKRDLYDPAVKGAVEMAARVYEGQAEEFAPGGAKADIGQEAIEGLLAAPLALLFSLAGALTHLFKSARYLTQLFVSSATITACLAACVLLLAGSALFQPNAVTRSGPFQELLARTAAAAGQPAALGVRWVTQAQPFAYPVNAWVREQLLGGYDFD